MKIILLIINIITISSVRAMNVAYPKQSSNSICLEGIIKWTTDEKEKQERSKYCLYKDLHGYSLTSQNCVDSPPVCLAKQNNKGPIPKSNLGQKLSSARFHLCQYLDAIPQSVKVWSGENWISITRCLFEDSSFVDLNQLYHFHQVQ